MPFILLVILVSALFPTLASAESGEATIVSDRLEWLERGARTVFSGHVVLTNGPYVLKAAEMTKIQATGLVKARGKVIGTFLNTTGEKSVAIGDFAEYDPRTETVNLWKNAKVTRWETAVDTAPVNVVADRFRVLRNEDVIYALKHVRITRGNEVEAVCQEARFEQKNGIIYLYGDQGVQILFQDSRGRGNFHSIRAEVYLNPKRLKLIEEVIGHLIPATTAPAKAAI